MRYYSWSKIYCHFFKTHKKLIIYLFVVVLQHGNNISVALWCIKSSVTTSWYVTREKIKNRHEIEYKQGRALRNYSSDKLREHVITNRVKLTKNKDVNAFWDNIITEIRLSLDDMCPIKRLKIQKHQDPWIDNDIVAVT